MNMQMIERMREADEAVRQALSDVIRKWIDEDDSSTFNRGQLFRPLLVGAIKPLAQVAADWGVIGDTPEAIAAGFERTVAETIRLYLADEGKAIGWAGKEARNDAG